MGFISSVDTNFTNPLANFTITKPGGAVPVSSSTGDAYEDMIGNADVGGGLNTLSMPDGYYRITISADNTKMTNSRWYMDLGTIQATIQYVSMAAATIPAHFTNSSLIVMVDKGVGNHIQHYSYTGTAVRNWIVTFEWVGPL